jgi:hypothetical protein
MIEDAVLTDKPSIIEGIECAPGILPRLLELPACLGQGFHQLDLLGRRQALDDGDHLLHLGF